MLGLSVDTDHTISNIGNIFEMSPSTGSGHSPRLLHYLELNI